MHTLITNGQIGGLRITDTTAWTGKARILQCLAETTIASYSGEVANLDAAALPAGSIITGAFTALTLTSGDVVLYF